MRAPRSRKDPRRLTESSIPEVVPDIAAEEIPPWELIDVGRYQPRRIRGSCRGRALG
jgi:hypothetical protein